jgi:hypothetical protein
MHGESTLNIEYSPDGKKKKNLVAMSDRSITVIYHGMSLTVLYMEAVAKRDKATLLPIIEKIVRPGSIIYSNECLSLILVIWIYLFF